VSTCNEAEDAMLAVASARRLRRFGPAPPIMLARLEQDYLRVVCRSRNAGGCDAEGETMEHYCIDSQNRDHTPAAVADLYENAMQGAIHNIVVYASGSRHSIWSAIW
jgi:hypothetical protein